jgi:hypothetical protein
MPTQTTIRIDSQLVEQLKLYKEIMGVPVTKSIEEAVKVWLECFATSRVESAVNNAHRISESTVAKAKQFLAPYAESLEAFEKAKKQNAKRKPALVSPFKTPAKESEK